MNLASLDVSILLPAFVAGLLVLATHVPLGQQVLARGIIFIDLAIAQIAGLGVIAAHSFQWEPGGWQVQLVAAASALGGSWLLYVAERRWPQIQEAFIGSIFVLAATAAILLLAANPRGGEHLRELLTGQILWVQYRELVVVAVLYAALLVAWYGFARQRSSLYFYLVFALAVTASVQLVGVYLVFASLIVPALATVRYGPRQRTAIAFVVGVIGFALGIVLSAALDLPTGALIVWTLALVAVAAHWLAARAPAR